MRILMMAMNYAPEETAGRLRADLCEYLAKIGHEVHVATAFPHYPKWEIFEGYRGKLFLRERLNGVMVYRSYVYIPNKANAIQRIMYDFSLSISSFLSCLSIPNIDVVLCVSPPLQMGITAYVLSKMHKAVFFLQLIDLVPDAGIALGLLRNPIAIKMARVLENFVYKRAHGIITICQGFADNLISKGVPNSKLMVLSDWVDTDTIKPGERNNSFRELHDIHSSDYLAVYTGSISVKQGLENVIEAAGRLKDSDGISFLIVGDGSQKAMLMQKAAKKGLTNVRFLPPQPRKSFAQVLSSADVLLLNQQGDVIDAVIPSKLLAYMSAGRPIVAAVHPDSETARYIRLADCGLVVPPEQPQALADAIRKMRSKPEVAARFARNARTFAEEHFAREKVLKRYAELFSSFAGPKPGSIKPSCSNNTSKS